MTVIAPSGLARRTLGTTSLIFFAVSASAPMTVLAGGVVTTYANTGVIGVPLSFLILGAALALFSVGYVAMARHISNAGPFYAYPAQGLGRVWGVTGGLVALVAYNAIQISLYGLIGFTIVNVVGGIFPWWIWSGLAWIAVAWLGILRVSINARVLAVLLVAEIAVIVTFDVGSFSNPDGGSISTLPMQFDSLWTSGIGGVFALGVAAFIGYETTTVYGEEARGSRAVASATFVAVGFMAIFYALSAWALAIAVGPNNVVAAAKDPTSGIPFSVIEQHWGSLVTNIALILLFTSVFAALLSFHNTVSRYIFSLARDGVLPASLGRIGSGASGGAPRSGSLIQSAIAFVVVAGFAVANADPLIQLFTWLSALAAIGVMSLMVLTSFATLGYFRARPDLRESAWARVIAPTLGAVVILAILATTVVNIESLLGPGAQLVAWILPGIVLASVIGGLIWGSVLRSSRPEVYDQVGVGLEQPLAALDHSLEQYRL
jgi:amino acid transporter